MLERVQIPLQIFNRKINDLTHAVQIKNPILKKTFSILFFLFTLHFVYSYIGVYKYMYERPCSVHASGQCQRASVAMNYYNVDMNFFKPRIQRFNNDDGITGLEFPIIYYTAAVLYKIFGFNDYYLRIISLLIISAGLLAAYLLTNRLLKNVLLSATIIWSVMLSPVLIYYTANFMPDAPGLGFTLLAWYYFFKYTDTNTKRHLGLFVFFGTMGALIKAVALLCFFIVLCLLVLDRFKKFRNSEGTQIFRNPLHLVISICIGMGIVVAWYTYAKWLSAYHGNMSFAMVPIIVDNLELWNYVMKYLENWTFQYYAKETYVLLFCATIFVIVAFKKLNRLLKSITLLYALGGICYVYLFFYQFAHHDYYFIALIPLSFFLVLTFTDGLIRLTTDYGKIVMLVFMVILFFNIGECLVKCKDNYVQRFDYRVYHGGDYRPYYDLEPKMRALGITRKDKIVSAFDDSYMNSLYFMNQPGFTVEGVYQHDTIQNAINAPNVKYLVVNDSAKFNKVFPNDFSKKIIIVHRGLIVYKLK